MELMLQSTALSSSQPHSRKGEKIMRHMIKEERVHYLRTHSFILALEDWGPGGFVISLDMHPELLKGELG